ncbi:uncharacterized protein LOC110735208 [Chenopodium quinoa]|uniref:uncharacterized protein LOC110735208 n=1 Tax=Chenopodium quinoa TaxID=63459 RepID=UPI000B77BF44|nr:uncharacterized protein LOC110735208 [Chenopodium quinoa]
MTAAWGDSDLEEEKDQPSEEMAHLCIMAKTDEKVKLQEYEDEVPVRGNNTWYLDSGCSKHETGDKSIFLSLDAYYGGTMTFGDNMKGDIIAIKNVGMSISHAIDNVFLVEGLQQKLLNISQFCDKGNFVSFTSNKYKIIHNDTAGNIILEGNRKGNTYTMDFNEVPTVV